MRAWSGEGWCGRGAFCVAAALISLSLGAHAQQTFYVDASHTGPAEGTRLNPFTTIAQASLSVTAGAGDTISVSGGSYPEIVVLPAETMLVSEDGAHNTVLAPGAAADVVTLAQGCVLQGFTIADSAGTAVSVSAGVSADVRNCVVSAADRGVWVQAGAQAVVDNNTFYGSRVGVVADAGASLLSLRNNIFSDCTVGVELAEGVNVANGYNSFWQCEEAYLPPRPAATDLAKQPLFVNAPEGNFHLRAISTLRDAGAPEPTFNDRDGSRNDLGADGGPSGTFDTLVPAIVVATTPAPAEGAAPLSILFDASTSSDEFGIASWSWNFDVEDENAIEGSGPSVPFVFTQAGGYLVELTVTDNSGNASTRLLRVRVGDAPVVEVSVQPPASIAPVAVNYAATATGVGFLEYEWDIDGDGEIDSRQARPRFEFVAGSEPGLYEGRLTVLDAVGQVTRVPVFFTLAQFPPQVQIAAAASAPVELRNEVADSPSFGASASVPANALNQDVTLTLSGIAPESLPLAPPAAALAAVHVAPNDLSLAAYARMTLPLATEPDMPELLAVWRLDAKTNVWSTEGVRKVRYIGGGAPQVLFETATLGTYAVTGALPDEAKQGCGCGGSESGKGIADGMVLAMAILFIVGSTSRRACRN